jgi:hypothetical protein
MRHRACIALYATGMATLAFTAPWNITAVMAVAWGASLVHAIGTRTSR